MDPSVSQVTEHEWLRVKGKIRQLYVFEELPLKKLIAAVEAMGIGVT
jgi:uncharacterized membrane protein YcgQ (UPF0703/DUF1980 family)